MNVGLKRIRGLGTKGCVLVGDPAFYRRCGFENNSALQMKGVPPKVLMCLPMDDEMLEGTVTHYPPFFVGE